MKKHLVFAVVAGLQALLFGETMEFQADFTSGTPGDWKLLGASKIAGEAGTQVVPSPDGRTICLFGKKSLCTGTEPGNKGVEIFPKGDLFRKGFRVTAVFRLHREAPTQPFPVLVLLDNRGITDVPKGDRTAERNCGFTFALTRHPGNPKAFRFSAWLGHGSVTDKVESVFEQDVRRDGGIGTVSFAYDGRKYYEFAFNGTRVWYGEAKAGGPCAAGPLPAVIGALSRNGKMPFDGEILAIRIFSDPQM